MIGTKSTHAKLHVKPWHYPEISHLPYSMSNWGPHGFGLGWVGLKWARSAEWAQTGPHMGQPILKLIQTNLNITLCVEYNKTEKVIGYTLRN